MIRRLWHRLWHGRPLQARWPLSAPPPVPQIPDQSTGPKRGYPKPRPRELAPFSECYHCGSTGYYEGPTGGLSMNITCSGCGARFNVCFLPDGIYFQEELSGPKPGWNPWVKS